MGMGGGREQRDRANKPRTLPPHLRRSCDSPYWPQQVWDIVAEVVCAVAAAGKPAGSPAVNPFEVDLDALDNLPPLERALMTVRARP